MWTRCTNAHQTGHCSRPSGSTHRPTGSADEQSGLDETVARAYRYRAWQHFVIVSHIAGNSVYLCDFGIDARVTALTGCCELLFRSPAVVTGQSLKRAAAVHTTHCKGRGAFSELLLLRVDG